MLTRKKCKNPTNIDRPTKAKVDLQTFYLSFSSLTCQPNTRLSNPHENKLQEALAFVSSPQAVEHTMRWWPLNHKIRKISAICSPTWCLTLYKIYEFLCQTICSCISASVFAPCKGVQGSFGFWTPRSGFRIFRHRIRVLCQWNLDSRFRSLVGFRIPWAVFRILEPRIPEISGNTVSFARDECIDI